MKSTDHLAVKGDTGLVRNVLILHPNDGYDLGLIAINSTMKLCIGATEEDFLSGKVSHSLASVRLENKCALSTLQMNAAWWNEIGKPRLIRLCCHENRILLQPAL